MKDSTYKDCVASYFEFYKERTGIEPRMNGIEGKALKMMITYLKTLGDGNALANFQAILANWHILEKKDKFYKNKYDLKFINSQLNSIIRILKDGRQAHEERLNSYE